MSMGTAPETFQEAIAHAMLRMWKTLRLAIFIPPLIVLTSEMQTFRLSQDPVRNWFVPGPIEFLPAVEGQTVLLKYTRHRYLNFHAEYTVKIISRDGDDFPVCAHSESLEYKQEKPGVDPTSLMTLDRFVGIACPLKAGNYRMEVSWLVLRANRYPVTISLEPVNFEVSKKPIDVPTP